MSTPVPVSADLEGEHTLVLRWSDGPTLWYALDDLRANCPCAPCNPEPGAARAPRGAFEGIGITSLEEVGTYALRLHFNDGHSTGIYTYERLHACGHPPGQVPPPEMPARFEV